MKTCQYRSNATAIRKRVANLHTRLVRKTPLHLHHRPAELIADARFAAMMLHGRGGVVGLPVGGHGPSAAVAVVAYAARVCFRCLCGGLSACDGVLAAFGVDFGWLLLYCRAFSQAVHDSWFPFVGWAGAGHGCWIV